MRVLIWILIFLVILWITIEIDYLQRELKECAHVVGEYQHELNKYKGYLGGDDRRPMDD